MSETLSPVVTVTTDANKWFKAGEAITLRGTVTDPASAGIKSVTVNGNSAAVTGNAWSYTFASHQDTAGTSCTVVGTDNLNNFGQTSYMLKVDTIAPVISGVVATPGYDQGGVRWYKLGASASIRANVTDATSQVKECKVHGESYTSGSAAMIDTSNEVSADSYTFTAMDNAGNTASSTPFVVGVDGTGPRVTISQYPVAKVWTDLVTLTVSASDVGGSGVSKIQYSIDGGRLIDCTGSIVVRQNCLVSVTATDNVGNTTTEEYEVVNIDEYPPVFKVTADTKTITASTKFNVVAEDRESSVKSLQYTLDGENWVGYTSGESIKVSTNHLTYTFRAEDTFGNVSFEVVSFDNIYTESERERLLDLADTEFEVATGDLLATEMLRLSSGAKLTLNETSGLAAQSVELSGGFLDVTQGNAAAHSIFVSGAGNSITGVVDGIGIASMEVANGAELAISKAQYDAFMTWRRFRSEGTITVSDASGAVLTQSEIELLIKSSAIRSVNFEMALVELNKLTFTENSSQIIGFAGATGTAKNDTITVKKGANIEFGSAGYAIDFLNGSNTITVNANAQMKMHAALYNVSSIRIDNGTTTKVSGVSGQNYTFADFAEVVFSKKYNANFTIGKFANVSAQSLTGNEKSDKISIGSNAEASFGSIAHICNITLAAGSKYKVLSTDSAKTQGITKLTADSITVDQTLKLSLGSYSAAWVSKIAAGGKNDTITVNSDAKFVSDFIYLEGGNDKIDFKKNSIGLLGEVNMGSGSNTMALASCAAVSGESFEKVTKLTLAAGKYNKNDGVTYTELNVSGNYVASSSNDSISIGNYAKFNVSGELDMAGGKDTITIGKDSVAVLKSSDASSITKFTIGKNSVAYLSSELFHAVTKLDKTAAVCDIGEWDVARNFTSIEEENSDDLFIAARSVDDEYQGWLGADIDNIDYIATDGASTLTWSNNDGLTLKLWDSSGASYAASGAVVDLTGYAAFSVEIAQPEKAECFAYTAKLA